MSILQGNVDAERYVPGSVWKKRRTVDGLRQLFESVIVVVDTREVYGASKPYVQFMYLTGQYNEPELFDLAGDYFSKYYEKI